LADRADREEPTCGERVTIGVSRLETEDCDRRPTTDDRRLRPATDDRDRLPRLRPTTDDYDRRLTTATDDCDR